MIDLYDILGLLGVALTLSAYARVQWRRDYAKRFGYSFMNLLGSVFLVISLVNEWNLASFTGNAIWALISLYGLFRCVKYMRRSRTLPEPCDAETEAGPSGC